MPFFGSFFGQAKNEQSWFSKIIAETLLLEQKNFFFKKLKHCLFSSLYFLKTKNEQYPIVIKSF